MDTQSNAGHAMSCAPAGSNGSNGAVVKSKGVQAREAAKRAFAELDFNAIEQRNKDSRVSEFLNLARLRDED